MAIGLIYMLLASQFESLVHPLTILFSVPLAGSGVILGLFLTGRTFGLTAFIGVLMLVGIVVKNGILLVEFTDKLRSEGVEISTALIDAGRIRMTPVLLTATATVLGLVPLAIGFNIDFASLFETGNPKIFFGGDSVAFWGPLSWTIIFGLTFATFITLIVLPVMYLIGYRLRNWWVARF